MTMKMCWQMMDLICLRMIARLIDVLADDGLDLSEDDS